jgi:NitT/TauT family transport system permease protein
MTNRGSVPNWLTRTSAIIFWLAIWQLASTVGGRFFASPIQVANALWELVPQITFWATVAVSGLRISMGFVAGALCGTVLAALASASIIARTLIAPLMNTLRAIPVVSFVVLVLIWRGPAALTIVVAAVLVAPVVFSAVVGGINAEDLELIEVARVYGATPLQRFRASMLPAVVPFFAAACQAGIGLAWKAGVSAELIGLPRGSIGEAIFDARLILATDQVIAWTVVVVAASALLEKLIGVAIRRFTPKVD